MAGGELALRIDLVDDLVLSASAASAGGHRSLRHIPGAVLRGLFAGRLYGKSGLDAYSMFHSGELRFGDAWPLAGNGAVALPMPLSLHYEKADEHRYWRKTRGGRRLVPELIENLAIAADDDDTQREPVARGFLEPGADWPQPAADLRMKTAIDEATGRSAEAQLFGYDAIAAGRSFLSLVEGPKKLLEALRSELEHRRFRIGRSKRAEYGRIEITEVQLTEELLGSGRTKAGDLVFWALSDLALIDEHGHPTSKPDPAEFCGGPGYCYVAERSWLRSRRYLPWNGQWGMPDLERVVIAAGSVLVFEPDNGASPARPSRWVGTGNEAGLGRVWANPPALESAQLETWDAGWVETAAATAADLSEPEQGLLDWLTARRTALHDRLDSEDDVAALLAEVRGHYQAAIAFAGAAAEASIGPGVSQWRQVATAVSAARKRQVLEDLLFGEKSGIAREDDEDWKQRFGTGAAATFHGWLRQQVRARLHAVAMDAPIPAPARRTLHRLANAVADWLQRARR